MTAETTDALLDVATSGATTAFRVNSVLCEHGLFGPLRAVTPLDGRVYVGVTCGRRREWVALADLEEFLSGS